MFAEGIGDGGMMQQTFRGLKSTDRAQTILLKRFEGGVSAGFPSPADDYSEGDIDLSSLLIENPPATFITRARGDSMLGAGVHSGDLLVVNRSLTPMDGSLVVAILDGDFTLKRLRLKKGRPWLYPENDKYAAIEIRDGMDFVIWGVIKHSIRFHQHEKA